MSFLAQADRALIDWGWIDRNSSPITDRLIEHLYLTVLAVVIGLVISVGLSMVALRYRRAYGPITAVTNIMFTIPSLALFALLVPFTGLTVLTAEIALVSYTLLIIIRNIVAGIDGVSPAVLEAADGMGYTRRRRFWKIEIPLAMPVIVAGLRIATVTTVGLVTVSAIIGLGGLGFYILRGLQTFFWTSVLVGTAGSVVIAVAFDVGFVFLERSLTPWLQRSRP
ncbi:MAG: ABC transporter permease [Acidimicrobiia bacterium]|nr:ABC transporter permease [Acidimicrobiia bacterium]